MPVLPLSQSSASGDPSHSSTAPNLSFKSLTRRYLYSQTNLPPNLTFRLTLNADGTCKSHSQSPHTTDGTHSEGTWEAERGKVVLTLRERYGDNDFSPSGKRIVDLRREFTRLKAE